MRTKRQIVADAFAEIGLASYAFDLEPEQIQGALRKLDALIATWETKGIHLGYAFASGEPDPDQDSGLPDSAVETVVAHLAIRIAPGYGKQVPTDTRIAARSGYDTLLIPAATPPEQQLRPILAGAGSRTGRLLTRTPDLSPLRGTTDGELDILEG